MQHFELKSLKYNFRNLILDIDKKYISVIGKSDNIQLLAMGEIRW